MKKRLLTVLLLFVIAAPFASAQMRYGVKADLLFTKMPFTKNEISSENRTGFRVGLTGEFGLPFVPVFFDGSIQYAEASTKLESEIDDKSVDLKRSSIYVPFNIKFKFDIFPTIRCFFKAGPDLILNLNNNSSSHQKTLEEMGLGQADPKFLNYGIHAGFGIELARKFEISAQYEMPLAEDYEYKGTTQLAKDFFGTKSKGVSISGVYYF